MFDKQSMAWSYHARSFLAGMTGLSAALCLALAPTTEAHAQPVPLLAAAATTTCAAPWNAATAYNGGATVSENDVNYVANWWSQGTDPATHNGAGQPWTSQGACGGGAPGPSPAPAPSECAPVWVASQVYTGGDEVSKDGVDYTANWWTRGDDPATHSGPAGSGQPWTAEGSCTGGGQPPAPPSPPSPPSPPTPPPPAPDFVFSPYKDVTISANWNTYLMRTAVTGTPIPIVGEGGLIPNYVPNLGAITLAFATGECGSEGWAGFPAQAWADENLPKLEAAGVKYIVSTGGAAGTFKCSSPAGMAKFINRYLSPQMVGVDFDIESGNKAMVDSLVSQVAYAEGQFPNLRFSFTLATWAASDGSHAGINSLGQMVVNAIKKAGLKHYTIDLMVMDYGRAGANVCVLNDQGKCDMGKSAIQAAENLEYTYGIPASKIALTPMIGVNDTNDEIFTLQDVDEMTQYVISHGLAGIHYWSLDRDTPCSVTSGGSRCNSVPSSTPLEYTKRFLNDLGK